MEELKSLIIGILLGVIFAVVIMCDAIDSQYFSLDKLNICAKNDVSIHKCLTDGKFKK